MHNDALADRGKRDEPGRALDQWRPKALLQLPQLATQGWLGYATAVRRATEVPQVGNRDQIAQLGRVIYAYLIWLLY